jgi:peptide subunit release factor 1 (eRF1)
MILEEIIGEVTCTIIRENGDEVQVTIGDYFSDHERSTLTVTGNGKIVIRVDPNCTVEVRGVEVEPVVQEVVVEDTVAATETPVIIKPAKTAKAE